MVALGWYWRSVCRCNMPSVDTFFVLYFVRSRWREGVLTAFCCNAWFGDIKASTSDRTDQDSEVMQLFLFAVQLELLGCECNFEYRKHTAGRNVFVGWLNVQVYVLLESVHSTFYLPGLAWCAEYEGCHVLMVQSLRLFSCFSGLVLLQPLWQGLLRSMALFELPCLPSFGSWASVETVMLGSLILMTLFVGTGRVFECYSALRFTSASMRSARTGSSMGLHSIPSARLSLSRDPLRLTGRVSPHCTPSFHISGKLARYSTC